MTNKNNYVRKKYDIEIIETGQIMEHCSMSIRGLNKTKPTDTKCHQCGGVIQVNEQYFNMGPNFHFCLGCVKY